MHPLDLIIEDYSTNEKMVYLPRKVTALRKASEGFEGRHRMICWDAEYSVVGPLRFYYQRIVGGTIARTVLDHRVEPAS